ncbi:MAG: bifunctional pyr operon transcriptional regulator/uracil phosphoribosyltransferase PyrR, partial [Betaproteobacteria bacterium]
MTQLALDAEALYQQLCRQVSTLLQASGPASVGLVGIWSGGAWLAERLHKDLALPGAAGSLSITLHRDDFAERGL